MILAANVFPDLDLYLILLVRDQNWTLIWYTFIETSNTISPSGYISIGAASRLCVFTDT
jgi:hypothetical protein